MLNQNISHPNPMDTTMKPCRHCGGQEFYSHYTSFSGHVGSLLPVGLFGPDDARVRVCGTCGLIEWFAASRTLESIKEKFTPDE